MADSQFHSNSFIKISNSPLFTKFLHDCCDEFIDGKLIDVKNYNNDIEIEWTSEDVFQTKKIVQEFFRICAINENFETGENVSQNVKIALKECFEIRKEEIEQYLIKEAFLRAGHNIVESIDWKLKWILGTSKLAYMREPILQIHLGCVQNEQKNSKPQDNTVSFELNLEEVDYLIKNLRDIRSELNP